jgi:hypothetical protein
MHTRRNTSSSRRVILNVRNCCSLTPGSRQREPPGAGGIACPANGIAPPKRIRGSEPAACASRRILTRPFVQQDEWQVTIAKSHRRAGGIAVRGNRGQRPPSRRFQRTETRADRDPNTGGSLRRQTRRRNTNQTTTSMQKLVRGLFPEAARTTAIVRMTTPSTTSQNPKRKCVSGV